MKFLVSRNKDLVIKNSTVIVLFNFDHKKPICKALLIKEKDGIYAIITAKLDFYTKNLPLSYGIMSNNEQTIICLSFCSNTKDYCSPIQANI